jgi:hypothetical protein
MATVLLGSNAPLAPAIGLQATKNGERPQSDPNAKLPSQTMVIIDTPDTDDFGRKIPLDKKLNEVRSAFALHSKEPASWVEGADEGFTSAVSQVFDCQVGRPTKPAASEDNE